MTVTIGRRQLLAALGGAAAWPFAGSAQQPAVPVIGVLSPESSTTENAGGLVEGLRELGYVEGRNIRFEHRWGMGNTNGSPI